MEPFGGGARFAGEAASILRASLAVLTDFTFITQ